MLVILCFINHKIHLMQEATLFITNGTIVEVNGHNINVYVSGNNKSDKTLVFLAGGGTCSPTLDFKSLYTLFEDEYQVAVVEKAGYGFSDTNCTDRKIDTILEETREGLRKAGVTNTEYILFPHSMSGIESIYWANKYPCEVKSIIGLDPAVPEAYDAMNINIGVLYLARFASEIGITRLLPGIANTSAAIQYGTLSEAEKQLYRAIFYRRTTTNPMIEETKMIKENAALVEKNDTVQIPMLFFVSDGNGTGYKIDEWHAFITNYLNKKKNGQCIFLNCSHYVHDIEYNRIYEESMKFMQEQSIDKN